MKQGDIDIPHVLSTLNETRFVHRACSVVGKRVWGRGGGWLEVIQMFI